MTQLKATAQLIESPAQKKQRKTQEAEATLKWEAEKSSATVRD